MMEQMGDSKISPVCGKTLILKMQRSHWTWHLLAQIKSEQDFNWGQKLLLVFNIYLNFKWKIKGT